MKKHTLRTILKAKGQKNLHVLTCYDFQTAQMLNDTELDMILVGDSLGNVILGHETTIPVQLETMILFAQAVKRGAPNKFTIVDMPFGQYALVEQGVKNAIRLFQESGAEAIKLEGASEAILEIITLLTQNGIPVMGHIGLTPQSVHQLGGYYTHGRNPESSERLKREAQSLQEAGCFALVLECVEHELASDISTQLKIPTIGIGSGEATSGQVLVINDLFHEGKQTPPKFCTPVAHLYEYKKEKIQQYLKGNS
jgi:3-methyl-2-oxobutanoate hydroxymethyltransferase